MEKTASLPIGVVLRRRPGATRWARWSWRVVGVLPGAGPADWRMIHEDGDQVDFHVATVEMILHRAETEAYRVALANDPPSVWVVLRPSDAGDVERPFSLHLVTASPYEGQDYLDSGEEIVESAPMPEGLVAWVRDFVEAHHVDETFKKRKRDRVDTDQLEDGVGDARVRQDFDVYRAPGDLKPKRSVH